MNHIPKLLLAVLACAIVLFTGVSIIVWFLGSPSKGKIPPKRGYSTSSRHCSPWCLLSGPGRDPCRLSNGRELGVDYLKLMCSVPKTMS